MTGLLISTSMRFEFFVAKCKHDSDVLTDSSSAGTKMHGYLGAVDALYLKLAQTPYIANVNF